MYAIDPPPRATDGDCLVEWLGVLMKTNAIAEVEEIARGPMRRIWKQTCCQKSSILGFSPPLGEQEKPPPEKNRFSFSKSAQSINCANLAKSQPFCNPSTAIDRIIQLPREKAFHAPLPICINWHRERIWQISENLKCLLSSFKAVLFWEGCWNDICCSDRERLLQLRARSSLSSIGTTRHHQPA